MAKVKYRVELAVKKCQILFRTYSSSALPVLAITGLRFCCKTNETSYIFDLYRVPRGRPKRHLDRQASSESSFFAIWIDRRRANAHFDPSGSTGVKRMLMFSNMDRQASSERSSRQGRQVRQVRQANQARHGRQARQVREARRVSQVRQVG